MVNLRHVITKKSESPHITALVATMLNLSYDNSRMDVVPC